MCVIFFFDPFCLFFHLFSTLLQLSVGVNGPLHFTGQNLENASNAFFKIWQTRKFKQEINHLIIVTAQLGETPASDWQSLRRLFARGRLANAAVQATACTQVMVQG